MGKKDPRVTAYIARSAPFARPVLKHLRAIVHEACPEAEETLKWGSPTFLYRGMLCGFASFKQHCTFGFWKSSLIVGKSSKSAEAMGQFGRLTSISDLPSKRVITSYVKKAMALNEAGVSIREGEPKRRRRPIAVPADLKAALARNRAANATFEGFPASQRYEYLEWITEAKQAETRARRIQTAIEWLAGGKRRNWKYERKANG